MPLRWLPRAMYAIAIAQTWPGAGQITMPDIAATSWQVIATLIPSGIKNAQLYALRMGGKEREIHAMTVIRCAMRRCFADRKLRHSPSRISQIVANGGNVRLREC
ncbi:Uncharacterised protein [Salmonella enterica subsp. enterica serovar Typhimurium str. DT104]|nr:Uncharacterised protein [Salmonella enterica subsp. enterica serovar Typhimurium str. DT104]